MPSPSTVGLSPRCLARAVPTRLARLHARTGLKMPDCCVLLAAQQHDGLIATFDTSLTTAATTLEIPLFHPN